MRQRVMIAIALALQPLAAHRRRADDRARRDDTGTDSRPDARDEDAPEGRRHPAHHPQSGGGRRNVRPRGRDVRRQDSGGGSGPGALQESAAPVYARPAGLAAARRRREERRGSRPFRAPSQTFTSFPPAASSRPGARSASRRAPTWSRPCSRHARATGCGAISTTIAMGISDVILDVQDLHVRFPLFGGIIPRKTAEVRAVEGVSLDAPSGRNDRARGRIRLREDDSRPRDCQHPARDELPRGHRGSDSLPPSRWHRRSGRAQPT